MKSDTSIGLLTVVMYVAVIVAAVAVTWNALSGPPSPAPAPQQAIGGEEYWDGWEELRELGPAKGPAEAPVVILEFVDYQCAFCQRLAPVLDSLVADFPTELQVVSIPFPLPQHRFAEVTAVAAHCAAARDQFPEMYSTLFALQDSVGLIGWDTMAERAGIRDQEGFERCLASERAAGAVQEAAALGRSIGVTGTPTVVVNGRRLRAEPTYATLHHAIQLVMEGGSPALSDTVDVSERNIESTGPFP